MRRPELWDSNPRLAERVEMRIKDAERAHRQAHGGSSAASRCLADRQPELTIQAHSRGFYCRRALLVSAVAAALAIAGVCPSQAKQGQGGVSAQGVGGVMLAGEQQEHTGVLGRLGLAISALRRLHPTGSVVRVVGEFGTAVIWSVTVWDRDEEGPATFEYELGNDGSIAGPNLVLRLEVHQGRPPPPAGYRYLPVEVTPPLPLFAIADGLSAGLMDDVSAVRHVHRVVAASAAPAPLEVVHASLQARRFLGRTHVIRLPFLGDLRWQSQESSRIVWRFLFARDGDGELIAEVDARSGETQLRRSPDE